MRIHLLALLSLLLFAGCDNSNASAAANLAPPTSRPATRPTSGPAVYRPGPEGWVDRLVEALEKQDFRTLYEHDLQVKSDLSEMEAINPKFALPDKMQAHRNECSRQYLHLFGGRFPEKYYEIAALVAYKPKVEFLESKSEGLGRTAYVRFTFKDVENAPVERVNGKPPSLELLKETVQSLVFDREGRFSHSNRNGEFDKYFPTPPSHVVGMTFSQYSDEFKIHVLGKVRSMIATVAVGEAPGVPLKIWRQDGVIVGKWPSGRGIAARPPWPIAIETNCDGSIDRVRLKRNLAGSDESSLRPQYGDDRWKARKTRLALGGGGEFSLKLDVVAPTTQPGR